jgi:hypothetical protein
MTSGLLILDVGHHGLDKLSVHVDDCEGSRGKGPVLGMHR